MDSPLVPLGQTIRPSVGFPASVAAQRGSAGGSAGATAQRLAREEPGDISFGDVLSALNPLQYLPVVGSIYRAVTGDTIPETL
jgi:hypothetical protein